ncbi:MAG TPA: DUF1501 domain-containing protein [Usitatibacter sp.]|nr:DUF1501 domain-containing protein [Usitatibacter sp.]
MDRRSILKALAAAPLAATLPAWSSRSSLEEGRLLILVFLYGGNDAFNTWVPYTDQTYYRVRPNLAVPRDAVLKITDTHGFHPSLAALMPSWQAHDLALVQGIGYGEATQQHYRDCEIAFTGADETIARDGWVTRALARRAPIEGALADAIAIGDLDVKEADPMGPFRGDRIGVVQVHHAHELLEKRRVSDCVIDTNTAGNKRAAGAGSIPGVALKTRFPADPLGNSARLAVELAAADRRLPVIHLALNGLDGDKHHSVDCHWDQLKYHADALKRLADALAALRAGLIEVGRWDDTLVATYDEFGRSPMENEDRGTHHGLASTHFVMGGRVKGGLYGEAPSVQRLHPIGGPAPVIDTRRLWTTVAERWWGGDASGLFNRRYAPVDLLRA